MKRQATERPHRPDARPVPVFGADRLSAVLNDIQPVPVGDLHDRRHVRHLSVEMRRNDRARSRGDLRFEESRVQVERYGVDVDKHGRRAQPCDTPGAREERERRRNHLIAGTDVKRHQRDKQCVAARRNADAVPTLRISRDALLQFADLIAENERISLDDRADRFHHLVVYRFMCPSEIQHRDFHRSAFRLFTNDREEELVQTESCGRVFGVKPSPETVNSAPQIPQFGDFESSLS